MTCWSSARGSWCGPTPWWRSARSRTTSGSAPDSPDGPDGPDGLREPVERGDGAVPRVRVVEALGASVPYVEQRALQVLEVVRRHQGRAGVVLDRVDEAADGVHHDVEAGAHGDVQRTARGAA